MRVRWTTDAADDLERIYDYIATDRPGAARNVATSIVRRIGDERQRCEGQLSRSLDPALSPL